MYALFRSFTLYFFSICIWVHQAAAADPYDGHWSGTDGQALSLTFQVRNDGLQTIQLDWDGQDAPCGLTQPLYIPYCANCRQIPQRQPTGFDLAHAANKVTYTFHIEFASAQSASGSVNIAGTGCAVPATFAWTAIRQNTGAAKDGTSTAVYKTGWGAIKTWVQGPQNKF